MKKINIVISFFFASFLFSQELQLSDAKKSNPLYIFNGIIGNLDMMNHINKKHITNSQLYKRKNLPQNYQGLMPHLDFGIMDVKMNENPDRSISTLSEVLLRNNLPQNTFVYLDGILVKDNSIKIFNEAIYEEKTISTSAGKVLNIWTLSDKNRKL